MRFSRDMEREALEGCQSDPQQHLIFGSGKPTPGVAPYQRRDGAIAVNRDGLQEFLHRRLFRTLVRTDLGRRRLVRTCDTWGCANPFHFRMAAGLEPRSREHCPNGHSYEGNTTPSGHCAICAGRRRARRATHLGPDAAAINAAKTHCPQGHEYTPENTYLYATSTGVHRKCRACNAERARQNRSTGARIVSDT